MGNAQSLGTTQGLVVASKSLAFLTFGERCAVGVSARPEAFLPKGESFWKWMVHRLCAERALTSPANDDGEPDWRESFVRLWSRRNKIVADPHLCARGLGAKREEGRLRVVVRLRPKQRSAQGGAVQITVPLHQRIALLRSRDANLGRAEATKQAVAVEKSGATLTASIVGHDGCVVHALAPFVGARSFELDAVLGETATQEDAWAQCSAVVLDAADGRSGAVFAYGQTGSGKTHTMFGTMFGSPGSPGIVRRAISCLALNVASKKMPRGQTLVLEATAVEVFGEALRDLANGIVLKAARFATDTPLENDSSIDAFLANVDSHKRSAATAMNSRSTRAHCVIEVRLVRRAESEDVVSRLVLVDLGGSERVKRSGVADEAKAAGGVCSGESETRTSWPEYYASRARLAETNHINKGLLALKRCVAALLEDGAAGRRNRIPFMDSKLTQLMRSSFESRSLCALICCSTDEADAVEAIESLNFGAACRELSTSRIDAVRGDGDVALAAAIRQIDSRVRALQVDICQKERWEWRETHRVDDINDMAASATALVDDEEMELGGKGAVRILADDGSSTRTRHSHTVRGQVIVGAEAENAKLENLLDQRRALVGA
ncbi:P-loop containing nucleoside triphosphate hydrolase protein [Pelagophyceae sp. CCMP2097]|nr:P-loop containing nucleoside triphosphate hydrolase protein [Pelagophyceae sp. CCMP2097]